MAEETTRRAPRVPPGPNSLAAAFAARQHRSRAYWHRILAAIEPWYDWGKTATIWRLDQVESDFSDESTGSAYQVELQWLGIHVGFVAGRVPPKISTAEVRRNKLRSRAQVRA